MFSREYFQGGESSYPIAALLHTREPGEGAGLPAGRVGSNRTLTFPVGPGEGGGLLLQCGHRPHPPNLSTGSSFPADSAKPVPLAVVSLRLAADFYKVPRATAVRILSAVRESILWILKLFSE